MVRPNMAFAMAPSVLQLLAPQRAGSVATRTSILRHLSTDAKRICMVRTYFTQAKRIGAPFAGYTNGDIAFDTSLMDVLRGVKSVRWGEY